jgi:hypothetical protein
MDSEDAEMQRMRYELKRLEREYEIVRFGKRKSAKGSFSVKKKLRAAPITKRMRSRAVTPRTAKKGDTRTSRSRQMQPRKLTFGSGTNSRSASRPRSMNIDAPLQKSVQYTQSRKVRHKNARTVLKKMPAGGKPYARGRKSMKRPKGAYRGAVMPKWAKGETKHTLMHDGTYSGATNAPVTTTCASLSKANLELSKEKGDELVMGLGTIKSWCMNPCAQGNELHARNGRSIDGTYLRIQGHVRNRDENNKAYLRMLVLAVKGGQTQTATSTAAGSGGHTATAKALFSHANLFKKIDGTIVGFDERSDSGKSGTARVRSLQLPVNKSLYTVLADQKMQLATTNESFGSSDRLFDLKIPLKQRTKFFDGDAASFETNQIVFVVYSVDPSCNDTPVALYDANSNEVANVGIPMEFESKYSYKDF